ncbi:MAG: T9SS type A sorting domain-containing protein, partial [Bacteroidota bacterium]
WRVRPYGEYHTCTSFSDRGNFKTSSVVSTIDLDSDKSWTIQPNPLPYGQSLLINIKSTIPFEGDIQVYDVTGHQLFNSSRYAFNAGDTQVELNLPDLSPGVYVMTLESENGILNKKLVITGQ